MPFAGHDAPPWPAQFDEDLRLAFASPGPGSDAPYRHVVRYLLTSFVDRRNAAGSAAYHPGAPSEHGSQVDALEGFSRLAPLLAAWLAGGRPAVIEDLKSRSIDVAQVLHAGIVAGTTPGGPGYWGRIRDWDQRTVEAADIARSLWIARDHLLPLLSEKELGHIGSWLLQVNGRRIPDNNWLLFVALVNEVLAALNLPAGLDSGRAAFERLLSFHRGQGWFTDGPDGHVDWYNVWAIHYDLFWLREVSPWYRTLAIDAIVREFAQTSPLLLGPEGIPIMGRSVCYRLASPAAVVAASAPSAGGGSILEPGLGRRALDAVWRYFAARGAFADGCITQGYCGTDLRVLDDYSGPSSPLWGTRPLVLAFLSGPDAPFWTAPELTLPVERASYRVTVPGAGWEVVGTHESGEVKLHIGGAPDSTPPGADVLDAYGPLRRAYGFLRRRPSRPPNLRAKYGLGVYSSRTPFCGCRPNAREPGPA